MVLSASPASRPVMRAVGLIELLDAL